MKKIFRLLLMALTMLLGLASCAEHDNPVDPNPLAKQVSGLWWSLADQEGTYKDATDSYPYTRIGQAICFNEDGTGYGITFFFNDDQGDPIAIIGGEGMCPFTYTSKADGRLSLDFSDAYYEYANYFKQWSMSYANEAVTATNGKLTLTLEKPSEQMAETIRDWDEQFNGGATMDDGFNPNDADFTFAKWREQQAIYLYDGTGEYTFTHEGRSCKFSKVPLPWYSGTKYTNLPDNFCNAITPENGWELVLNLCGNTESSLKNSNFFALYNKYLGILRFFYYLPEGYSTGNDHVWEISMSDHLAQQSLYGYGVPSDRSITNKAAIGQNGSDSYREYVAPWVKNMSNDGLIVPNVGWWAFDVDLSMYRDGNVNPDDIISLQMRSWNTTHTTLYSAITANIEGTLKASLKLDQVKTKSSNTAKGVLMGLQAAAQAGSSIANFVSGNWAGGLTSLGQALGTGSSLASLGGGGPTNYTGSLDGTISLGMNGNINTDGVISGSATTVGIASPTISMKDFDLANSHFGQGVWNLKTAPVVYWTGCQVGWHNFHDGSAQFCTNYNPYVFDPGSVEIELNPNVFPENQIEWIEVDAICGARSDRQPVNDNLITLRSAYGVGGPTYRTLGTSPTNGGQTTKWDEDLAIECLWDFLYGYKDKHGMEAKHTIYTSEQKSGRWNWTSNGKIYYWYESIKGRGANGFAIEPQYLGGWNYTCMPFLEVNVKVLVKMMGLQQPIVLSRNYLPEIKEYGDGKDFAASTKKTRPYASKMKGHTDLYDYQMKRISDIIERYSLPGGKWDSYNYIPMASSDPYEKDNYGYDKLFDGTSTDWYTSIKKDGVWFAEFKSRQPITPSKYYLTTCINTSSYPHYNPKNWKVMAKANQGDSWTTIATVTNDSRLPADNRKRIEYDLSVTGRQWQYFRFEISDNHGGVFMQLAEFEFDKK